MQNNKLAVIGASSMVGSRFCELYRGQIIKADFKGKISIDITNRKLVNSFFSDYSFERALLFSAYTDVDGAEKQRNNQKGSCWKINVGGVKNLIQACIKHNRKLIFISTDFVFDGSSGPYGEEDERGPDLSKVSWYGITKAKAEEEVENSLEDFIILRISYPYRAKFDSKEDFARQILRRSNEGTLYPMFADQQITPTFIDDLAPAIRLLINKDQRGIFHLASPNTTTPYDFACYLLEVFRLDSTKVQQSSIRDFLKDPSKTPRPIKGGMKMARIEKFGFKPTDWRKGLEMIFEQMQAS